MAIAAAAFEVVVIDRRLTVRRNSDGFVIEHDRTWDEDTALYVAAELAEKPNRVRYFDWVSA